MNNTMPIQQLTIDLSQNTGPVKHGATGFLYGLGNDGLPSVNILAPLKPQVAAQKPEGGRQHPNGDALDVSNTFLVAGGKEIEIYLQDVYAEWPYETLGLEDYLARVEPVVRQVMAHTNRKLFSYVPFNEPDQIWYNKEDKKEAFFSDWKTACARIKAIDPSARIVGPNLANYDSRFYRDFMAYAQANDCLPDVVSWHELNDGFFSGWYGRYDDYRAIERDLSIAAREICINEYARIKGDLGIPGKLIQWITRFEDSKVDACLAYWTSAGCLNDLVAQDTYNQPTGGWWVYHWYAGLSGSTVKVTPPDANAEGLQGLAALDESKKQVRVIFGGASGSTNIVVQGFDAAPYFGEQVHAAVWAAASSGVQPSPAPALTMEGEYPVRDGQVCIPVKEMVDTTAYRLIITPAQGLHQAASQDWYEAQYADIAGSAKVTYGEAGSPAMGFVEGYAESHDASTSFILLAPADGFYELRLAYRAGPLAGAPAERALRVVVNGKQHNHLALPATPDWETWSQQAMTVFLTAGINRVAFAGFTGGNRGALHIRHIEVRPGSGIVQAYEAEDAQNTIAGAARVMNDFVASQGKYVGNIGGGAENFLQFNNITVPRDGTYPLVICFANAEFRGGHAYNSQVVDRCAEISVNGGAAQKVYFRNTFAWDHYQTRVVEVDLRAGQNTIRFSNRGADSYAPNIDRIVLFCEK